MSVKQDFTQLTANLSERDCFDSSIISTVSGCEESTAADDDDVSADVADATAGETDVADHVELNSEQDSSGERVDEHWHEIPCDTTSHRPQSPVERDESYDSRLIHTEAGPQRDKFCVCSSDDHEDATHSDQLSEAKLKKASLKRKPSAECEASNGLRRTSPDGKKRSRNMEMSPPQHIRTSSGIFVVHEVAQHGKMMNISYQSSISEMLN